jgi:hypothetical protein
VSVVVSLLHSLRFLIRSRAALHLEIVALRHRLAVTNRSRRPRLCLTPSIVCYGLGCRSEDVRALIREMSTANPLWGASRIHGELQKLGISMSQSTVAKYMRRHRRPPSQTWRTFLIKTAVTIGSRRSPCASIPVTTDCTAVHSTLCVEFELSRMAAISRARSGVRRRLPYELAGFETVGCSHFDFQ